MESITPKIKVAIYARVSTKDQDPQMQIDELTAYAKSKEYEIVGTYVDKVTGDIEKRNKNGIKSEFDIMMHYARESKFNAILVWKYDRFARSVIHLISSLEEFEKLNIAFISLKDQVDTTTPMGKFFFQLMGSFAEFERSLIKERCDAGRTRAMENGIKFGPKEKHSKEIQIKIVADHIYGYQLKDIAARHDMSDDTIYAILRRNVTGAKCNRESCKLCDKARANLAKSLGLEPKPIS